MAKSDKKTATTPKETQADPAAPVKFHHLSDNEKKVVMERMARGEVALQGPDHHIVEIK